MIPPMQGEIEFSVSLTYI